MGLYVQREALLSAQKSLDITGNNLSNLETPGYTRQRVDMASIANSRSNLGYNSARSLAGQGSEIVGVAQVRDALLDTKFRNYTSDYGNSNTKSTMLEQLEDALDNLESEDTGFMSVIASLKSALQGYSSDNADRRELGTIVMNNARSVADMLRALDSRITDISKQTLSEATHSVDSVNTILTQLAALNKSIKTSYINMGYIKLDNNNYSVQNNYGPLELKDSFHLLIDQLSEYGDVSVTEHEDGGHTVTLGGRVVVANDQYAQVALRDKSYDIPTVPRVDGSTPLNDVQAAELANPDPGDMQFVILNAGVKDPDSGKYSGLKNSEEWGDLEKFLYNMGKTKDDFLRGDGEILFDRYSADYLTRKVSEKWDNHQLDDFTDNVTGIASGSIRGLIDLYNGRGTFAAEGENAYEGVEYFRGLVNSYAKTFADSLNGIYNKEDHTYPGIDNTDDQLLFNYNYRYYYTDAAGERQDASYFISIDGELASDRFGFSSDRELTAGGYYQVIDGNGNAINVFDIPEIADAIKAEIDSVGALNVGPLTTIINDYLAGAGLTDPKYALTVSETGALATALDADTVTGVAGSMEVSDFWQNNAEFISNPDGYDESSALDNTWINRMLGAFNVKHPYAGNASTYAFEEFVSHYGNELGNRIQYEKKITGTSEVMLLSVTDIRDSVMGVNVDEEGINMMNYQKWYNAIARMTTALDEALDKLINGTGRVGL
ncbi:MAG: flagellar basal body protein [Ruminococcus sp.]|jgi:flagellar hook-associated protein FlgK|nr:flagellar basal body protein [Ruminococcus sp.]